jgi:putative chitinase
MLLLEEDLLAIMPRAKHKIKFFIDPINETLEEFNINTELRVAAFLSQIAVESGELRYTKEIWGPTPQQLKYEGRKDLGNTEPGDGERYMGRGLIQITGRANYKACGDALGVTLLAYPEKLEELPLCVKSAGWYWSSRNLNEVADEGDIKAVTKKVNGGYTHLEQRTAYYDKAIETLYV